MEKGRLLEPKLSLGQNAGLRAGIEKETEGVAPVSTRHSLRQFPLRPCTPGNFHCTPTPSRCDGAARLRRACGRNRA